jgi:hypothetical protein
VVYGPSYGDKKTLFIDELHKILASWQGPWFIGGDFNLSRFPSDKSTGRINQNLAYCFNDWINRWGLIEVNPSNRKFTWSNNQEKAVLAKLDRIFVPTDWEAAFPLVRVSALPKNISGHNPLLVDTGANCSIATKKFRFEKWWLERSDFMDMVEKVWKLECKETDPMEVWQFRVRSFRKLIRGWASNVIAELNKYKQTVVAEFNFLDFEAENRMLERDEIVRMKELARELDKIWALEEIRARQKARDRIILEGDRNTAYFHAIANHRNRKKKIECLKGPDGLVHDTKGILKIAVGYYKKLFGRVDRGSFSLQPDFWDVGDKVTLEENRALQAPFLEEEVKAAVFNCYPEGAPG